jgi:hypothetical protein
VTDAAIVAQGLEKPFGDAKAVDGVDLTVQQALACASASCWWSSRSARPRTGG